MKAYYDIEMTQDPIKNFTDEELDREYNNENELIMCRRCKKMHRRGGAPSEIQIARAARELSKYLLREIDNAVIDKLKNGEI